MNDVLKGKLAPELLADVKTEEKKSIFSRCHPRIVGDGKDRHIEADCHTKEDAHEFAELLEKEVVIRVKPTKVTEEFAFTTKEELAEARK